jgi:methylphosphotriester-DNA--protein-cysteine methyltransferase
MTSLKTYTLLGADGTPYQSAVKRQLGGHRRSRIYGDEPTAIAAGYRPCATCCPDRYQQWQSSRQGPDVTRHRR